MNKSDILMVTCALIPRQGKVLLAQRADSGLWELPGGKVRPKEDLAACLIREIKEELAADIEVLRPIYIVKHRDELPHLDLHCFLCRLDGSEPQALEHKAIAWLTLEAALELNLCPPDRTLFQRLKAMNFFKHIEA